MNFRPKLGSNILPLKESRPSDVFILGNWYFCEDTSLV